MLYWDLSLFCCPWGYQLVSTVLVVHRMWTTVSDLLGNGSRTIKSILHKATEQALEGNSYRSMFPLAAFKQVQCELKALYLILNPFTCWELPEFGCVYTQIVLIYLTPVSKLMDSSGVAIPKSVWRLLSIYHKPKAETGKHNLSFC